ncbi:ATP-binding protein [Streptomyces sp. 3MP-14]|uniref:ATP-binding protein n=1 Tax=Streptomyces mimosae TaxID=2586635 RepID=A0A5N6AE99_9ACTN|nr:MULTISPECIES: ATP-binding protein [Streptomyces]KAB8166373.1 ATP-binding protein [Streptomyces mimosae]KAB8174166.1 ATP-binding protein [Streptomyces sp. 3MP-14]
MSAHPSTLQEPPSALFSCEVLADARGIETWRRTVTQVMRSWGASDAAVEVARMGLSELLANVVRHVPVPRCRLWVVCDGRQVTVAVADGSPEMPVVREPDWDAESGRGLWLLREMVDAVGCYPRGYATPAGPAEGKVVWFTCAFSCAAGCAEDAN